MKTAIVLLGAGASIDFGGPSTDGLTAKIEKQVMADAVMNGTGGDRAFREIKTQLTGYLESVNYEQIYHVAHELLSTYPTSPGANDEFKPVMQPFVSNTTNLAEDALRSLCDKIVQSIMQEISASCSMAQPPLLKALADFINTLRQGYVTRIYTTNHDDFPLQAVSDLYTGFAPAKKSGLAQFELDKFWQREELSSIFHLHGSVHMGFPPPPVGEIGELFWFDDRAEAQRFSSFSGTPRQRMDGSSVLRTAVITGLEKLSRIQQRPFTHFYSMMSRDAMRADLIFVIGSGLADLHLNTWLAEARSRTPQPPLVFVDFWQNGFEDETYFELDAKTIALFHSLKVNVSGSHRGQRLEDWLFSQDKKAAIWDKGFGTLLNSPSALSFVLSHI